MRSLLRTVLLLGVLAASLGLAATARAQLKIGLETERMNYLLYAPIPLKLTLENAAGFDLVFADEDAKPWLSFYITQDDGTVVAPGAPDSNQVVSAETADTVLQMMTVATTSNIAKTVTIPGYRIAAKTGTAEVVLDPAAGYDPVQRIVTTAGVFPADDPQFVVAIMVDNPAHGLEGGDVAAPLFNEIASYELQHAHVPPTGSLSKHVPLQVCGNQDRRYLPANVC